MFDKVMKKMNPAMEMEETEQESPDEASLTDLIKMIEQLIATKGMSKKKPAAEVSVTMVGKPEVEAMEGEEVAVPKSDDEEDEDAVKSKLFG